MPLGLRVYGPIQLAFSGGGDRVALGFSKEGFKISFKHEYEDVLVDAYGSKIPFDVQYMGATAEISGDLSVFSSAGLTALQAASIYATPGSRAREDGAGMINLHMNNGTGDVALFTRVMLVEPLEYNLSTKHTELKVKFKAFPPNFLSTVSWYTLTI